MTQKSGVLSYSAVEASNHAQSLLLSFYESVEATEKITSANLNISVRQWPFSQEDPTS